MSYRADVLSCVTVSLVLVFSNVMVWWEAEDMMVLVMYVLWPSGERVCLDLVSELGNLLVLCFLS